MTAQYSRQLDLNNLLEKKSFFLFGPRATGKSTLIGCQLTAVDVIKLDLLRSDMYMRLSQNPGELEGIVRADEEAKVVVIDEVQRVPELLNEVHRLIESTDLRFVLTGSSARKLRRQSVNLLAGRAWQANLHPLVSVEITDFSLDRYLQYGGLPAVYTSAEPAEELHAYVDTYLKEEIQAEALVKRTPAFSKFLMLAARTSGDVLNYSKIASDVGVSVNTLREYYAILSDTFLGFHVPMWQQSQHRRAAARDKFYFFDIGVAQSIAGVKVLERQSNLYGRAFEHFIAMELRAYLSYRRIHEALSCWRTQRGEYEVDFIVGTEIAIEVKTTDNVKDKHLRGLVELKQIGNIERHILVSHDTVERVESGVRMMHWKTFLRCLWQDKLLKN